MGPGGEQVRKGEGLAVEGQQYKASMHIGISETEEQLVAEIGISYVTILRYGNNTSISYVIVIIYNKWI